jgi:hypothetical protein
MEKTDKNKNIFNSLIQKKQEITDQKLYQSVLPSETTDKASKIQDIKLKQKYWKKKAPQKIGMMSILSKSLLCGEKNIQQVHDQIQFEELQFQSEINSSQNEINSFHNKINSSYLKQYPQVCVNNQIKDGEKKSQVNDRYSEDFIIIPQKDDFVEKSEIYSIILSKQAESCKNSEIRDLLGLFIYYVLQSEVVRTEVLKQSESKYISEVYESLCKKLQNNNNISSEMIQTLNQAFQLYILHQEKLLQLQNQKKIKSDNQLSEEDKTTIKFFLTEGTSVEVIKNMYNSNQAVLLFIKQYEEEKRKNQLNLQSEKEEDEYLKECAVCFRTYGELYKDENNKNVLCIQKSLSCGHHFCEHCVEIIRVNGKNYCPLCRGQMQSMVIDWKK